MSVYMTYTVNVVPGKRFAGIEHMKKMAAWIKENYGVTSEILGNMGGPVYENHIIMRFDSLGHMEELTGKLLEDPEYMQWFGEAEGLIKWKSARQAVYQVF